MGIAEYFFRNVVYLPIARYQAGPVDRLLDHFLESQFQSIDILRASQAERLTPLVEHARRHVPFYRDGLPAGFQAGNSPLQMVTDLPFLLKSDLQTSAERLRSTADLGRLALKTTGGSTGQPVTLWKTRSAWALELAATWRGYYWAGIAMGDKQARFWGVPHRTAARLKARAIDFTCHRLRLSAFSFGDADLAGYLSALRKFKPRYFYGYVSMLREFADYLSRTGQSLGFPLTATVTTSEVLTPADRDLMTEAFGAPVFNEYGCGELGSVAHECEAGRLHLTEENMIVEVLSGEKPAAPGEPGELVVTELNNFAFPLIRYRTGDFGTLSPNPCPCGRNLRVLDSIQGRAYDFIRNRDGRLFHGEFIMYIFEDIQSQGAGIKQFQVVQEDLDRFLIRIVADDDFDTRWEGIIMDRIREHVDPSATFSVEYPPDIQRESSGKLRLIKGLGQVDGQ